MSVLCKVVGSLHLHTNVCPQSENGDLEKENILFEGVKAKNKSCTLLAVITHDLFYFLLFVTVNAVENFPLSAFCEITLCLSLQSSFFVSMLCILYFDFHYTSKLKFLQNKVMEPALKHLCWNDSVDYSWAPSDWLYDSSLHWNNIFNFNWLSSSMNAHKCEEHEAHSVRTLLSPCLPAAVIDCVIIFFKENHHWRFWTYVGSLCELCRCFSYSQCHSCRDISSKLGVHT